MNVQCMPARPTNFHVTGRAVSQMVGKFLHVSRLASSEWIDDDAARLGASLAFYTLLSLAPFIVIAVAVAAAFYGQDAAQGRLASEISDIAGNDVAQTIQEIIKDAWKPGRSIVTTLLGMVTLAFGASSIFVEMQSALNTIWQVSPRPGQSSLATIMRLTRNRVYSFATVLGAGLLLLLSLLSSTWLAAMRIAVPRGTVSLLLYLIMAVLFACVYKIVPDADVKWSDVTAGALLTSLLFILGKQVMGLYFAHNSLSSTYSAAGSPIVVLLWLYYSAQILFWGAEFTKVYTTTLGSRRAAGA